MQGFTEPSGVCTDMKHRLFCHVRSSSLITRLAIIKVNRTNTTLSKCIFPKPQKRQEHKRNDTSLVDLAKYEKIYSKGLVNPLGAKSCLPHVPLWLVSNFSPSKLQNSPQLYSWILAISHEHAFDVAFCDIVRYRDTCNSADVQHFIFWNS